VNAKWTVVIQVWPYIKIWRVVLAYGHNNDQRMFTSFGTQNLIENSRIDLAADKGYTHHRLHRPDEHPMIGYVRKMVEWSFAQVQTAHTSCNRKQAAFRRSLELQIDTLVFNYHRIQAFLEQNKFKLMV
jgi:hypothetical protein